MLLLITAFIWGSSFVAQSVGMAHVGPFTFQAVRSLLGGAVLLPVIIFGDLVKKKNGMCKKNDRGGRRVLLLGGGTCGALLCAASCLQQIGISYTTVGKAGFISSLYILIVPLIGLFCGRSVSPKLWGCIAVSAAGLYFLCVDEGFYISGGDVLVIIGAFFFALHIMAVDRFAARTDSAKLSCIQFFVSGLVSSVPMLLFENPQVGAVFDARWSILYAGALSCGVGYTLQVVGQKYAKPAVASLIMSLESLFAVITAAVFLREYPTLREFAGCLLMFCAIIAAPIPERSGKDEKKRRILYYGKRK